MTSRFLSRNLRSPLIAAALFVVASTDLFPQQVPQGVTPEQAATMLQRNPALASQLRQRLQQSGLRPNEIRARLRAAGFPSNFLDAYIDLDSDSLPAPSADIMAAVGILGITPESPGDSLFLAGDTTALRLLADSLRADSISAAEALGIETLEIFGLNVFRQATTQFQPLVTGPVDAGYRLGPGDVLVLILTGDVELAHTLEVTRDGFVFIPQVGQVFVNNLTLEQLNSVLYDRLGRVYSGVSRGAGATTTFDVTVARIRVNSIRVIGEVARPGTYPLPATATALSAIYDAGGLIRRSNFREVQIRRGGELVASLDLYDYLLRGTVSDDVALENGDVVFVPVRGPRVTVVGEVKRPAIYEVKRGETLADLINYAGGFTAAAHLDAATISRILPPDQRSAAGRARTVRTVNLMSTMNGTVPPEPLFDGDSLTVFAAAGRERNSVTVIGSVWQPGTYQLPDGARLWDLVETAGGLRPETYSGRAQILRLRPDSTQYLVGVRLPADSSEPPPDNPVLQEFDEVTIFTTTEFRPERTIAVRGAVNRPGRVNFSDSLTLRDAIMLAGGLRDDAYLSEAEVSRLLSRPSRTGDTLSVIVRVAMDSSFVFDTTAYVARPTGVDRAPEFFLEPYDQVFVRVQPGLERQRNVVITGEVLFPGIYSLTAKDERLVDLITRAGGLTPQAYPSGIRFFRKQNRTGRINLDLPEALEDRSHRDNLVLASRDSIHIPEYIPTVRVEGEVHSPTSVAYLPNKSVGYYIKSAGGFTDDAEKGDTFVQQPNGLIQDRGKKPEPGATVVVPPKDPEDRGIDIGLLLAGIAQALSALTTILLVIDRL